VQGVGAGGAGRTRTSPKVFICRKFWQNLKKYGQRRFDIF